MVRAVEKRDDVRIAMPPRLSPIFCAAVVFIVLVGAPVQPANAKAASIAIDEPVLELPAFKVRGNPVEDFGFRVSPAFDVERSQGRKAVYTPVVDLVLPNTAASKAGIQPGDRIVLADGAATGVGSFSLRGWSRLQRAKWEQMRTTPSGVEWQLVLEEPVAGKLREVKLQLPTPSPRWGAAVWRAPADRVAARIAEAGPLAERTQQVLDHGIAMLLRQTYVDGFGFAKTAAQPEVLGYQWTLWDERGGHRMFVTTHRGRTEVILEFIAQANQRLKTDGSPAQSPDPTLASERTVLGGRAWAYLTNPTGELQAAWRLGEKQLLEVAAAKPGFAAEVEFWLERVGRVSERWPLEVKAGAR